MKKKIFTLLTLGLMLSLVCANVNAQTFIGGEMEITNSFNPANFWPAATDEADAATLDLLGIGNIYSGCEYTLTIDLSLNHWTGNSTDPFSGNGWMYLSVPRNIVTNLPDSIELETGQDVYTFKFTISQTDVNRSANRLQVMHGLTYNTNFSFYFKDNTDNIYGWANHGGGYNPGNILARPVFSIYPTTTYPSLLSVRISLISGNADYTFYSLDAGVNWTKLVLDPDTDDYYLTPHEIENMSTRILFKDPNSCYWQDLPVYGEDYPWPNQITRRITIPDLPDMVISPMGMTHRVQSWSDFVFYVTLTGANVGKVITVKSYPEIYPDGSPVPILYNYLGNNTTQVTIKNIRTGLNLDILAAVGNEAITGTNVWAEGGQVFINSVAAGIASIYTATGALAKTVTFASGELASAALPAGFYVAVINGNAFKFIIK